MTLTPDIIGFIREFGITALLLLGGGWFMYKRVLPTVLARIEQDYDALIARDKEYRSFLVDEIRTLRIESKADKDLMRQAFERNTVAFTTLERTQEAVRIELKELRGDIEEVKGDVRTVYRLVGEEKKLLERDIKDRQTS